MKSFIPLIALLLMTFSLLPLYSQSAAVVSYVEGEGFQLVRNGQSSSYSVADDGVIGMPLESGDTILTDQGSFVEFILNDGNDAVVKLAENTTFTITSLDGEGGVVFQVSYGRILVNAVSLSGESKLWITGSDTVAGVRGSKFGYDLFFDIAVEGGETQTAVYCFEGEVDVLQYDKATVSKIDLMGREPHMLTAGKMVRALSTSPDQKLKSKNIEDEIRAYWNEYPIVTPVGGSLSVSEDLNLDSLSVGTDKWTYETGGKITFAMGIGLMTLGGLLKAFLPDNSSANGLSTGLLAIGGGAVVAGGGMMLYSISLP
jgi:hypothetical protein